PGASKPFGKPKAKKSKKSKGTPTLSAPDEPAMTMAAALSGKAAPSADDVDDASGPAMDADTMPPKKSGKARKALKPAIAATGLSLAGDSVPWTVRRAHDATCPAYSNDALKAAYPALAK